jgi:hypothetical protein
MKAIERGKESLPIQNAIPPVVRYDDSKHQVPKGLSLLGIHPECKWDNSMHTDSEDSQQILALARGGIRSLSGQAER